ncbi:hypothetical protein B0H14DRAFT_3504688 [Mycena olivaceomarginata]|nr:hypothetical protein B0H14DRAFT_3504688 [Mycena olivaceomarginata]
MFEIFKPLSHLALNNAALLSEYWGTWFQPKPPEDIPIYDFDDLPVTTAPLYDTKGSLVAFVPRNNGGNTSKTVIKASSHERSSLVARQARKSSHVLIPTRDLSRLRGPPKSFISTPPLQWDGWPNGDFSAVFPMDFVERQKNLYVHWATQTLGGRGGSTQADSWEGGKLTHRQCQGVICENLECGVVTRPHTRSQSVEKQLLKPCICGANLVHRTVMFDLLYIPSLVVCGIKTVGHTIILARRFASIWARRRATSLQPLFSSKPKTGPLKLLVGHPTASGPAESVSKISPLLVNADRIKYQRRKEFAKLQQSHPNFFRSSQFGQVSVIVMQTPFMASRLVKSVAVDTEAVNGIVSDAAHGFWADQNSILIISSTYEPTHLRCWVPGLISYSNGATTEHYRIQRWKGRLQLPGYEEGGCTVLSNQRDGFRKILFELPRSPLKSLQDFQSAFGWLYHITEPLGKKEIPPGIANTMSYFRTRSVILKRCAGSGYDHFSWLA